VARERAGVLRAVPPFAVVPVFVARGFAEAALPVAELLAVPFLDAVARAPVAFAAVPIALGAVARFLVVPVDLVAVPAAREVAPPAVDREAAAVRRPPVERPRPEPLSAPSALFRGRTGSSPSQPMQCTLSPESGIRILPQTSHGSGNGRAKETQSQAG